MPPEPPSTGITDAVAAPATGTDRPGQPPRATDTGARPQRQREPRWPAVATLIVTTASIVLLWEVGVRLFEVRTYVLPPPSDVALAFVERGDRLWFHAVRTGQEALLGFFIGGLTAYLLGVGMSYSRFLERVALPYVIAANTVPVVAIAPLVILWLGPGMSSKVFVTAFLVLFPVTINTLRGMRNVERTHAELMMILGASRWQEFWRLRFYASLPFVFTGLRIGATMAVIGAIVAEFVGSNRGLGFVMVQSSYLLDTTFLWAAMIVSSLMGMSMFVAVVLIERWTVPWASSAAP